ncbi:MAG: tetratricopeptide repeat protein [Chloroflexia bacterium]
MFDAHPSNSQHMEETQHGSWQWYLEAAKHATATGDFEQAKASYLAALSLAEQETGWSHAAVSALHSLLNECFVQESTQRANLLLRLARIYWRLNEFKAFPLEEEALAIRERLLGADHPETIRVVETMARGHSALISFTKAIPLWERVLIHLDGADRVNAPNQANATLAVLMSLGEAYEAVDDHTNAELVWHRVLDLTSQRAAELHWSPKLLRFGHRLEALYGIGCACNHQGHWREAEELLQRAVAEHRHCQNQYFSKHGGAYSFGRDDGLHALAMALRGQER